MKPLRASDFRARRLMLQDRDFALAPGKYPGPTNLIPKATGECIVSLPDDVSIRTSDHYGSQLEEMWEYWRIWVRVVLAVQALTGTLRSHQPQLPWRVATFKTYTIVLHELKLAHPQLKDLPYEPPRITFDQFRQP